MHSLYLLGMASCLYSLVPAGLGLAGVRLVWGYRARVGIYLRVGYPRSGSIG